MYTITCYAHISSSEFTKVTEVTILPLSWPKNSKRVMLHSAGLVSVSQNQNTLNLQCQRQSYSKKSFRAALWALLSASFSYQVHAACCAPASPVSLFSGTDAFHGPHRYTCQRTSGNYAPRGTASDELLVHYTHPSAGEVTGQGACWVKGLLYHCRNTVERLCHLRSFPAHLGEMSH